MDENSSNKGNRAEIKKEENLNINNNDSEEILFIKEKLNINFDSLYQEIKLWEIDG